MSRATAPSLSRWFRAFLLPVSTPPWVAFWIVNALVLTVPGSLHEWKLSLLDFLWLDSIAPRVTPAENIQRLVNFLDLIPAILILTAIATVAAAPLRGRWVEQSFRLSESEQGRSLAEIIGYVHENAPGVLVRSNMRRTDVVAFVYPRGYRSASLAVFGGLILLWRRDRAAAEGVIRHELSHHRRGDMLTLGAASPLDGVLRHWLWISILFGTVPYAILRVADLTDLLRSWGTSALGYSARQVLLMSLDVTLLFVISTAMVMASIVMVIAGSWSAELAADYEADIKGSSCIPALRGGRAGGAGGWLRNRITHPPAALRRRVAGRGTVARALTPILIYPAGWLVQLFWLLIMASVADLQAEGLRPTMILRQEWANIVSWAGSHWPYWAVAFLMIILWPAAGSYWRRAVTSTT
jgi:Zn-dependent protease with chaperone function